MTTNHPDDASSRLIATDIKLSVIAKAPAGSGKTTLLVTRFLTALLSVESPESVLAITFTRKAASEMRQRIMVALALASGPQPTLAHQIPLWKLAQKVAEVDSRLQWHLLENPDRLRVMTMDSLNGSIIRHAPLFSGIGGGVPVEDDLHLIYRQAVLALLPYMDDPSDPLSEDIKFVMSLASNRFDTLSDLLSPLLATRDQWLHQATLLRQDPSSLDTFLDQWLTSLVNDRLQVLRELAGRPLIDFANALHANQLVASAPPAFSVEALPAWREIADTLLTTASRPTVRKTVNKSNGFPPGSPGLSGAKDSLAEMGEIEALAEALTAVRGLPAPSEILPARVARAAMARVLVLLAAELKVVFTKAGKVDHIEVAMRANMALEEAGGSLPLLQQVDEDITHIMVDEAQDTSISQIGTLKLLTDGWQPGDGRSIFIVGDPQQSIYAFRQAEVRLFLDLWSSQRFGDIQLTRAVLTHNYRSTEEVVNFVNDTFSRSMPSRDEPYSGSVAYTPSVSTQGPDGKIHFSTFSDNQPRSEALSIVSAIAAIPSDQSVAILVRSRAALADVLPALRDAGISYACQDIDLITLTDHVRDLLALVKSLWHPLDRASWITMLRAPFCGLSWASIQAVAQNPTESIESQLRGICADTARAIDSSDRLAIERVVACLDQASSTAPAGAPLAERSMALWSSLNGHLTVSPSQLDDVYAAINAVRQTESAGVIADLAVLERTLSKLFAVAGNGRVQIMTIHKSKGLEFDHVVLPGLWRKQPPEDSPALVYRSVPGGVVIAARADPFSQDRSSDQLYRVIRGLNVASAEAEDKRLLYVAFTRAKRCLHIYAMTKTDQKTGAETSSLTSTESLLESIWPSIQVAACACRQPSMMLGRTPPPASPKTVVLTNAAKSLAYPVGFAPVAKGILRPSEKLLRPDGPAGVDTVARNTGIVFHALVDRWIKTDRGESFEDGFDSTRLSMIAGFRRLGTKRDEIPDAVDLVTSLARSMLAGFNGKWVIAARDIEGSERRIAAFIDGKWSDGIIDRYFIERGEVHVVDYKSSAPPATVLESAQRHGSQLGHYAKVLSESFSLPAKSYVYYPSHDVLHQLS